MKLNYFFYGELWIYAGQGAWHFVTLPINYAQEIKNLNLSLQKSFGSVPVKVKIGDSTWNTSLFPDGKTKSYVLPVKKEVRLKNNLEAGQEVQVELSILEP